jgi:hypothetical protein
MDKKCVKQDDSYKFQEYIDFIINKSVLGSYEYIKRDIIMFFPLQLISKGNNDIGEKWFYSYHTEYDYGYDGTKKSKKLQIFIENKQYMSENILDNRNISSECVVCYDNTTSSIICCNQHLCKKCLQNLCKMECPMCRKTIDYWSKKITIPHKIIFMLWGL